jgi:hypothetical protein
MAIKKNLRVLAQGANVGWKKKHIGRFNKNLIGGWGWIFTQLSTYLENWTQNKARVLDPRPKHLIFYMPGPATHH